LTLNVLNEGYKNHEFITCYVDFIYFLSNLANALLSVDLLIILFSITFKSRVSFVNQVIKKSLLLSAFFTYDVVAMKRISL